MLVPFSDRKKSSASRKTKRKEDQSLCLMFKHSHFSEQNRVFVFCMIQPEWDIIPTVPSGGQTLYLWAKTHPTTLQCLQYCHMTLFMFGSHRIKKRDHDQYQAGGSGATWCRRCVLWECQESVVCVCCVFHWSGRRNQGRNIPGTGSPATPWTPSGSTEGCRQAASKPTFSLKNFKNKNGRHG